MPLSSDTQQSVITTKARRKRKAMRFALGTVLVTVIFTASLHLITNALSGSAASDLRGSDRDGNGIRDDIDALIAERTDAHNFNPGQTVALTVLAAGIQAIQSQPVLTRADSLRIETTISHYYYCLVVEPGLSGQPERRSEPPRSPHLTPVSLATASTESQPGAHAAYFTPIATTARNIESHTVNTPDRAERYEAYSRHLSAAEIHAPSTQLCQAIRAGERLP